MKLLNIVLVSSLFCITFASCSKEDIGSETPDNPTVVEIKEENLSGIWTMSREDNCMKITTSFEMKENNSCVYTQTIKDGYLDENKEVNKVSFNGKWSYDKKSGILIFELNDEEGNHALTLDCAVSVSKIKVASFKIKDTFSENDDYCFTKTN
ncbi:MAG: hypothetical protein K2M11_02905 [Paramuribaculum sp.]|nr:hypothetical protein [Paramuribaculum sp.]